MPLDRNNLLFGFRNKLTAEQKTYVNAMLDNQLVIVNACAGTGKTTLAIVAAALLNKPLIYVFAPIEEDKTGYRPGTQTEKEAAYLGALYGALCEINEDPDRVINTDEHAAPNKDGRVWVFPGSHVFRRGTNIKDCTVIIDEAQNFTKAQLKKVLTRCHDSCKVIMIGHSGQIDLPCAEQSGFIPYLRHFEGRPYCKVISLTMNFRGRLSQDADALI